MSRFRRFLSAFVLFAALGSAACNASLVGTEECPPEAVECRGGGGGPTHGSDN